MYAQYHASQTRTRRSSSLADLVHTLKMAQDSHTLCHFYYIQHVIIALKTTKLFVDLVLRRRGYLQWMHQHRTDNPLN